MKTINQWFDQYGVSHKNSTNILIHKFCVPLIMFSVLGLLWMVKLGSLYFNLAILVSIAALIFYFKLGMKAFTLMITQIFIMICFIITIEPMISNHFLFYFGIFLVAWVFQFVGHKIEGQKPSFLEDLQFLLIGPLWILRPIFFKELL